MIELLNTIAGGKIYDLAHSLEAATPTSPNHPPFRMALLRRHGDLVRADGGSGANELFTMGSHTGTHIDALCHVSHNGRLFGGLDATAASVGGRFRELGVERIKPLVGRGILLDVPRAHGLDALEPSHAITDGELAHTAQLQRTEPSAGDVVLVRTGWPLGRYENAEALIGHKSGVPGPNESGAAWLSSRQVRATGSDTIAYEWLAPGAGHSLLPVHRHLLVEHGIHIIEMVDLEALANDRVHQFLFIAIPLKLVGATGSPVRPIAIVA